MSIELNADQLKYATANVLIGHLVKWQEGHVKREVADHLANCVVEALYEAALISSQEGPEKGIIAGLKMIKAWQD